MLGVSKASEFEAGMMDISHLYFEELRMVSWELREIGPEEVPSENSAQIILAVD